jgi:hypothetical protein
MSMRAVLHRWSLVGVVVLGGCVASQNLSPGLASENRKFSRLEDAVAALQADEEENAAAGKPRVRLTVLGSPVASRYVDASFQVPEGAFVMVVAVDLDRRIRVVFPEKPDQSGFVARNNSTHMTRFFTGFGYARNFGRYSSFYSVSQPITRYSGGGVLLAIASDKPLQFDRLIDSDGEWNEKLLERVVFDVSARTAARALGKAVTIAGQEFGLDYSSFRGFNSGISSFASNGFNDCSGFDDFGYTGYDGGYVSGYSLGGSGAPVVYFQQGGVVYAQYQYASRCGRPQYSAPVPVRSIPATPRDTTHADSAMATTYRSALASRMAPSAAGLRTPRTQVAAESSGIREANRTTSDGATRSRTPDQMIRRPVRGFEVGDRNSLTPRERAQPRTEADNVAPTRAPQASPAPVP